MSLYTLVVPLLLYATSFVGQTSAQISGLAWHGAENGYGLLFNVGIDRQKPKEATIQWGTVDTTNVKFQNFTGPSLLYTEENMLCWASQDGLGHWFDLDELEEINYFGPPYDTGTNVVAFADQADGYALWIVNDVSNTKLSVNELDPNTLQLHHKFDVGMKDTTDVLVMDNFNNMLLYTEADGFLFVDKNRTHPGKSMRRGGFATTQAKSTCKGTPVALSYPWGWPEEEDLYAVITREGDNIFHASSYNTSTHECKLGYTFDLSDSHWTSSEWAANEDAVFQWMDAYHALVVKTNEKLFYALPGGSGPAAPPTIVDLTHKLGVKPSSILALVSMMY